MPDQPSQSLPKRQPGEARIVPAPPTNWAHKIIETVTGVPLDPAWWHYASRQDKFMHLAPQIGAVGLGALKGLASTMKGSAAPIRKFGQGTDAEYVPEEMWGSTFYGDAGSKVPGVEMGLADWPLSHSGIKVPSSVQQAAVEQLHRSAPRAVRTITSEAPISRREFFQANRELPRDMKIDRHMRADYEHGKLTAIDEPESPMHTMGSDDIDELYPEWSQEIDKAYKTLSDTYNDVQAPTLLQGLRSAVQSTKPIVEAQRMLTRPEGVSQEARRAFLKLLTGRK